MLENVYPRCSVQAACLPADFSIFSVPWERYMFVVKFFVIQDPPIFIVKSVAGLV